MRYRRGVIRFPSDLFYSSFQNKFLPSPFYEKPFSSLPSELIDFYIRMRRVNLKSTH